jgi:WD40 repeat protein
VYDLPAERQPITVQNVSALQRLRELPISETIYALDWSPDGSTLAAAGNSGVWLYNIAALDQTPRHLQVPGGPTLDAAFSPDGSLLATAHTDGTVRLWDVIIGGQRSTLTGPTDPVYAVAFSGDGTLLAAAAGSQIWVWDAATLEQRATLDDHTAAITALTFSPDSTLLASVDESGAVFLWDTVSLTLAMTAQNAPITALTFTPDSTRLLLSDTAIRLWDFVTGETITLAEMNASDLLILPDLLIIANANGLNINSSDGTPLTLLESGTASHHVILSPDGTVLADIATTIRLWGVISG